MENKTFNRVAAAVALLAWGLGCYLITVADPNVPWFIVPIFGFIVGMTAIVVPAALLVVFVYLVCVILGVDFDE